VIGYGWFYLTFREILSDTPSALAQRASPPILPYPYFHVERPNVEIGNVVPITVAFSQTHRER